jgi:hypothetical protein
MLVFITMLPLILHLIAFNYESLPPKEVGNSAAQPHARYNILYAGCRLLIAIVDITTEESSIVSPMTVLCLGTLCFLVLIRTPARIRCCGITFNHLKINDPARIRCCGITFRHLETNEVASEGGLELRSSGRAGLDSLWSLNSRVGEFTNG